MFLHKLLCNLGFIYEFRTDYLLLIFQLLWIVISVPAFSSPDEVRLIFATMLALKHPNQKPQTQTVRTSFVAGVRQPAGTIHQYLA
jgi:hypothetical protein